MPSWSTFLWYNYFMRHIFQRSQFLFKQSNIHDVCCLHKIHSYERKLVWWLTAWDLGAQSWRWEMSRWAFDIIFSGSFSIFATFHLTFSVIKWSLIPCVSSILECCRHSWLAGSCPRSSTATTSGDPKNQWNSSFFARNLLRQCDTEGIKQNALVIRTSDSEAALKPLYI